MAAADKCPRKVVIAAGENGGDLYKVSGIV
jgi:hypothetical protein